VPWGGNGPGTFLLLGPRYSKPASHPAEEWVVTVHRSPPPGASPAGAPAGGNMSTILNLRDDELSNITGGGGVVSKVEDLAGDVSQILG